MRRPASGLSCLPVKKHVVILGAGFVGLELAMRLSDSLVDDVRVTLIDQNDSFSFGFSKLDILFGRKTAADVLVQYRDISKEGVEFRQEHVTPVPLFYASDAEAAIAHAADSSRTTHAASTAVD